MSEVRDAVATMGNILPDDVGGRDAVHVAVLSVVTGAAMKPGTHVGFRPEKDPETGEHVVLPLVSNIDLVGIVDPFVNGDLFGDIPEGKRVWLYLYPRTITGLSHRWTHPMIPEEDEPNRKFKSQEWLINFSRDHNLGAYHDLLERVEEALTDGDEYVTIYGSDAYGEIPEEFWHHVEVVTGKKLPSGHRPEHFSCSC